MANWVSNFLQKNLFSNHIRADKINAVYAYFVNQGKQKLADQVKSLIEKKLNISFDWRENALKAVGLDDAAFALKLADFTAGMLAWLYLIGSATANRVNNLYDPETQTDDYVSYLLISWAVNGEPAYERPINVRELASQGR